MLTFQKFGLECIGMSSSRWAECGIGMLSRYADECRQCRSGMLCQHIPPRTAVAKVRVGMPLPPGKMLTRMSCLYNPTNFANFSEHIETPNSSDCVTYRMNDELDNLEAIEELCRILRALSNKKSQLTTGQVSSLLFI